MTAVVFVLIDIDRVDSPWMYWQYARVGMAVTSDLYNALKLKLLAKTVREVLPLLKGKLFVLHLLQWPASKSYVQM